MGDDGDLRPGDSAGGEVMSPQKQRVGTDLPPPCQALLSNRQEVTSGLLCCLSRRSVAECSAGRTIGPPRIASWAADQTASIVMLSKGARGISNPASVDNSLAPPFSPSPPVG